MVEQSMQDRYFRLLKAYVARPEETHLAAAADLGRELVRADVPPEEIAELHEVALRRLAQEWPDMTLLDAARLISTPLMELLMAYGLAFRERLETRERAEAALRQRAHELTTLNAFGRNVSSSLVLDDVVQTALGEIVDSIAFDLALFFLREGDRLLLQGVVSKNPKFQHEETPVHRVGECLCGLAVSEGNPIYSSNIHRDPRCTWEECKKVGLRSFAALPLHSAGEIIGVLALASGTERDFGQQAAFLETVAGQVAVALQNALLYEQVGRHRAKLEARVAERTAELAAANKALEAFSYSVSHDLRAPLRAISGFAQIIADRHRAGLDEEGQRYFDNIIRASAHMNQLIDDLLRYARLGRTAVRRRPVPLGDLLPEVVRYLSGRVAETGAQLSIPDDLPVVQGDQTLLSQIFINLIDNALTYHRPGVPPRVVVSCQTEAEHVIISVADNGVGIRPELHEKIFDIFQRLHSQDEHPGTGIGLAIVKKAVELLGGRVWLESVVGEGSTFYFTCVMRDA